jgi:hypothetical protein
MTVTQQLSRFYDFLDRPLFGWSRVVLAVLVIPLVLAFGEPLWKISLRAPQYPNGLWMEIYMHKVEGGNDGQHIKEINTLNHYIGMHKIDRGELADLDWLPFAVGLLVVLALRCAAIGNVRALIDLVVVTSYVTVFAFGRFIYKMYVFGHTLDPTAPLKVKPFTPAIFGTKQIANFTTTSMPQLGSLFVGIFATGITVLLCWHLIAGRVAMLRTEQVATKDV